MGHPSGAFLKVTIKVCERWPAATVTVLVPLGLKSVAKAATARLILFSSFVSLVVSPVIGLIGRRFGHGVADIDPHSKLRVDKR